MSRKSSRRGGRKADLYQANCSIEFLEIRTLLSTATINAGSAVRTVPTNMLGVNTAPWDSLLNSSTTLSMSQAAGINAIRIGGGSTADTWRWNATTNSESIGQMADYVANLNATGVITIDYGTGSPQEGVALWAYLNGSPTDTFSIGSGEQWNGTSWASVNWGTVGQWASLRAGTTVNNHSLGANHAAAFNFTYFETGNEIYGSWETDDHGKTGDTLPMPGAATPKAHDPTTIISFSRQFQTEINTILADGSESGSVPISIGIDSQSVATSGGNSFSNWIGNILSQSVSQGFKLGYIADHYYTATSPGSETDAGLLAVSNTPTSTSSTSNSYNWSQRATLYDNLIQSAIVAGGTAGTTYLGGVQLIADEVNSLSSSPGQQSVSLVNGLFIADALGSALATTGSNGIGGYQGFWIWDLHNGSGGGLVSTGLYGWRHYGDYGIIGSGSGASTNEPSPDYFAIQLASKFIQPGGTVVAASEDNESTIDTFAVLEPNGHLELLVINKTENGLNNNTTGTPALLSETFNISGFAAGSQAQIWQFGSAQDNQQEAGTTPTLASSIQSLSITNSSFAFAFPSYSMTVIDLTPETFAAATGSNLAINLSSAGPVTLNSAGGTLTVTQNGQQVSFTGISAITINDAGTGDVLNTTGSLTLNLAGVTTATIDVTGGSVTFAPAATLNLGALSIASGATAVISPAIINTPGVLNLQSLTVNGTLDVTNNEVIINYVSSADPISGIAGLITSGFAGGTWAGPGIISSTAQTNLNYGLGFADAADSGNPAGLPAGQIEILYTLLGDANLDSKVNGTDFAILATNFNQAVTGWDQGDFNYDGKANGTDFALLASNFNQGSQIAVAATVTNTSSTTSIQTSGVASLHDNRGARKALRSGGRKS